jgi:hypothetical protein
MNHSMVPHLSPFPVVVDSNGEYDQNIVKAVMIMITVKNERGLINDALISVR